MVESGFRVSELKNAAPVGEIWKEQKKSRKSSRKGRLARLISAPKRPERTYRVVEVISRNIDVHDEVLYRARGKCERCGQVAPFISKSTGKPYLEVHHLERLVDDGDDTVDNAIALCPICHREYHYA